MHAAGTNAALMNRVSRKILSVDSRMLRAVLSSDLALISPEGLW
jgi:hypothetical protein